ncbi:vWA domain-containing protein [Sporocytophaga myxococcoides]|uniref:vWA domain-containing protein n=1 Tax=Sporocytophaga myxococcoides TaxID=153721 RepID=UPI00138B1083|nr:vWA domain-containing protein [Sporocytophaga myxococcoides]
MLMRKKTIFLLTTFWFAFACSLYGNNFLSLFKKTSTKEELTPPDPSPKQKKIKVALLLDTSNSMDGLIEQAKSQLWTIVNELAQAKCDGIKPTIQIALYEYGNDRLSAMEGYIKMVTPLTDDLDKISEDLFKLTTNGGSEFCGHVIQTACNQLDWSPDGNDLQVIFIAGNEPFNQGGVPYQKACALANSRNVVVNTIYCGPYQEGINGLWKNGADITKGNYMSIEQDRKTVYIPSPYDDKISDLNTQLNTTYIEYGNLGKEKKIKQVEQDANAEKYGKENKVNRAVSKSTHVYKNKSWDLVDASDEKDFKVEEVQTADLPQEMQNMTTDQKQKYIETKKADREKIKTEIQQLNIQREKYIVEQKKSETPEKSLDKAMLEAIKKQAAQKNLTF